MSNEFVVKNGLITPSVQVSGTSSGNTTIVAASVASGTVTLPATTDTLVGKATTDTLTNKSISGSTNTLTNIPNSALTNSSVTVGTTSIALGASSTTLSGLTSVSSTAFTGALIGNASTATTLQTARAINGVSFDGSANVTVHTAGTGISISGTSVAIDSTVATLTGIQTLTNKTLTAPTVTGGLSTDTITTSGAGTIGGNLTVTGNLTINGTTTTSNSTNTAYADSLIELHYSNGGTLTSNDGKDVGIRMHYYTTSDKNAALVLANDTQNLEFYADGTETNGVFSGTYGTFKGLQYKSVATTGTAPLIVASTTRVANLNAETAGIATNIAGGTFGDLTYQTGSSSTGFISFSTATFGQALVAGYGAPYWGTPANATTATNVSGGSFGDLLYQTGSSATGFISFSTATPGQALVAGYGTPYWGTPPNATTATNVSGGTASVTTLTASSAVTLSGGTANGVAYLNGSKVLTTGSALTFDGSTLTAPTLVGNTFNNFTFTAPAGTTSTLTSAISSGATLTATGASSPTGYGVISNPRATVVSTGGAGSPALIGSYNSPTIISSDAGSVLFVYGSQNVARRASSTDLGSVSGSALYGTISTAGHTAGLPATAFTSTITGVNAAAAVPVGTAGTVTSITTSLNLAGAAGQTTTVTTAYGHQHLATIGNATGTAFTVGSYYGMYLGAPTVGANATITNRYGIYQADTTATNYIGGTLNVTGALTQNSNQVLHAGNYNSYSPTLTGTGASGTWGISISGNAATATTATNISGGTSSVTSETVSGNLTLTGGTANGVAYLDGSKVVTTGSALVFDGANLGIGTSSPAARLDLLGTASGASNNFRLTSYQFQNAFMLLNMPNNGTYTSFEFQEAGTTQGSLRRYGSAYGSGLSSAIQLANGSNTLTFDSSGNLGLGVTPSAWGNGGNIQLSGANVFANIGITYGANAYYNGGWKYITTGYGASYQNQVSGQHQFFTSTGTGTAGNAITFTQAMTLDASGNLLVGTTSQENSSKIAMTFTSANNGLALNETSNSSGTLFLFFRQSSATIGSVARVGTTSAVVFNTTSDYRLKTIVGTVTGQGERIDALKPVDYLWKEGGQQARGFLAHEFQTVYANSVTGDKDAVDADGNPVYQAMQAGSAEVIADLVAEVQSLRKRLAAAGI